MSHCVWFDTATVMAKWWRLAQYGWC